MTNKLNLFVLSTRQQLTVDVKGKTVLGRQSGVDEDGTLNIDLSPFMAYQLGVSRRHLMLIPEDDKVLAFDLSSRNGTFINSEMISSRKGYEIKDGDELSLGSLNIRIYITTEVPYLELQTRQLPPLEQTMQTEVPEGSSITAPLPDIRETLSAMAVHANSLEEEEIFEDTPNGNKSNA